MATTMRSVGFAIGTTGKAEVKNDFAEVRTAGESAFKAVADSAEQAGDRAARAAEAASERQIATWKRQAAAAKEAFVRQSANASIDDALGSTGSQKFAAVNLDRGAGSARDSASVFQAAFAEQAEREAAATRDAAAAYQLFEAHARSAMQVYRDDLADRAAKDRRAEAVATRDAAIAYQLFEARAREAGQAERDRAAAVEKLRMAIDPAYAAQQRFNAELAEARLLISRGDITLDEYSRRLVQLQGGLEQVGSGAGRTNYALKQTAMQIPDIVQGILGGQSAFQVLIQQGGQVAQIGMQAEGGLKGMATSALAMVPPLTAGAVAVGAVTAGVLLGTVAWYNYSSAVDKLNMLAQGSGRMIGATGEALEASAEQAARAGEITVGAARDIEATYVSTGKIGMGVLAGLTAATRDFAAATGQEADAAAQALASAFADPAKGADELTARYGILNAATLDYVHTLVDQGREEDAQRILLKALEASFDGAADHAMGLARAWSYIKSEASQAWAWMGKAIDRAVTGGNLSQQLASLQDQRSRMVARGFPTDSVDQQITAKMAELQQQQRAAGNARAKADAVAGLGVVDAYTGDGARGDLQSKLTAVNKLLSDNGRAAGLSAEQLGNAREAQQAYTRAVDTYLAPAEKQRQLDALDARIAAARTPGQKAALAAQRERVQLAGQVVTAADAESQAHSRGAAALATASKAGAGHAATLARDAASMEVSAAAALTVADAYLKSAAAGLLAEGQRKAATDATKKGIDVAAQAQRQANLQAAEGAASGAKSVAQLRELTAARQAANDSVAQGKLATADLNRILSDEAAIRPLLALQAVAQGDAYDRLSKVIAAYRQSLADAHAEESRSQAAASLEALRRRSEDAELARRYAGDTSGAFERAKADLAAKREAQDRRYSDPDAAAVRAAAVRAAGDDLTASRASNAATALRTEQDRLAVAGDELTLLGKSSEEHDRLIARLQLQRQLVRDLGDGYATFAPAILAAHDAADEANARLKVMAASMGEVREFGSRFADTVLSPDTWSSWSAAGKAATKQIEQEFLKLALLNPLKNLINGNSALPTIGSITKLLGGGLNLASLASGTNSALAASNASFKLPGITGLPSHNATGTARWTGGMTYVNENGGEVMDLPTGTRIYPAAESRQLMQAANDRGGPVHNHYHLEGAVLTQDLVDQMNAIGTMAAVQGAQGGARLAEDRAGRRVRYRIPGR